MVSNETHLHERIVMSKSTRTPLKIQVANDRWSAYGTTIRHLFLTKVLDRLGGISDSTPPGWYNFDLKRRGLKFEISLTPHAE
jgi:hypothetical protein